MFWQQKQGSYCATRGLHSGQQGPKVCMLYSNTGYIQPSQQRAARAWAKSHRTAGPAVRPAEAQGLRDPLVGPPGLWQGAALLLPPEKTACIQLPGPAAAAHATAGSRRRALTRPKDEKTRHSGSRAAGGEEGRRLQSVVAFHPRKEPPGREKLNRRQLVPRWKGEVPQNTSAEKEGQGRRDCWSPRPPSNPQPHREAAARDASRGTEEKRHHLSVLRGKRGKQQHLLGPPGVALCPSHRAPSSPSWSTEAKEKSADSFCGARGEWPSAPQTQENDREAPAPQPATVRPTHSWATSHHTVRHNIKVEVASLYFRVHSETKSAECPSCDQMGAAERTPCIHQPGWPLAHHQLTSPLPQE